MKWYTERGEVEHRERVAYFLLYKHILILNQITNMLNQVTRLITVHNITMGQIVIIIFFTRQLTSKGHIFETEQTSISIHANNSKIPCKIWGY